jgi:HK97 family phage major capsid protein
MSYSDQIKVKRTELQTLSNQAKALHADLETRATAAAKASGDEKAKLEQGLTDDRVKLDNMLTDGKAKRADLDRLIELEDTDQALNRPDPTRTKQRGHATPIQKSWGRLVVESDEFKTAEKGSTATKPRMERVNVKALYGSSEGAGGALVQTQRLPDVIDIPQRPRSILDYINQSETNSDAVEYAALTTRTNNAAPVAEYTGGNFGLKPESNLVWTLVTTNVKTIATWVPASRRILADAPRLENMIDVDLTEMVRIALENEIFAGDGTGEHFLGIINTPGILLRTQGAGARSKAADTVADTIRRGITDIILGFYTPNAVMLNPTDGEEVDLQKDTTGQYVMYRDAATGRIWQLARVETAALTANTALVGDFMMAATIWDRMQTEIRVGEPNDFFLRNAVAILGELRAAFAVTRPQAVAKITLVDPS